MADLLALTDSGLLSSGIGTNMLKEIIHNLIVVSQQGLEFFILDVLDGPEPAVNTCHGELSKLRVRFAVGIDSYIRLAMPI